MTKKIKITRSIKVYNFENSDILVNKTNQTVQTN